MCPRNSQRQGKWRYVLLAALIIALFIQYQHRSPKRHFSDFHYPYMTGKLLLAGEKIYSFQTGFSYFKYPPFYATLMVPLSVLPEQLAASLWLLFNVLCLLILLMYSRKIIAPCDDRDPLWLYVTTVVVMFRFLLENLHQGQANVFMTTLVTLGLYCHLQRKDIKAGLMLGGAIMTKYMPVVLLPYLLLRRNWKLLFASAATIMALIVFPAMGYGWAATTTLHRELVGFLFASSLDPWSIYCYPNQSLLGALARLFWEESPYPIHLASLDTSGLYMIFIGASALLYWLVVWPARRPAARPPSVTQHAERWALCLDWGMLFICMALLNPNGWKNFFVCLMFPFMLVIQHLMNVKFKDRIVLALGLGAFLAMSGTSEFWVYGFAKNTFEIWPCVTLGSLLLFAALAVLKWRHHRGVPVQSSSDTIPNSVNHVSPEFQ